MELKTILLITDNQNNQVNGVVTTYQNITRLARNDGYEIVRITPDDFKYISAPGYPEVKLAAPFGIGELISHTDFDYVHIATEGPVGLFAKRYLDRKGIPYTTSYHTRFPEYMKRLHGVPESITWRYIQWFHKNSQTVLVPSESARIELLSHDIHQVSIWTRGIDRDHLRPSIEHIPHDQKPLALYAGRISKEKGLDRLCALQYDYHVVIVGDGPYRTELELAFPHVSFWGYLHGQQLADAYRMADVFVFPSRTDTFGLVMIEAMSMGTPVAAYPVPGPRDVITNGVNGYMRFDLGDAIQEALELPRDRVAESTKKWSWYTSWKQFETALVDAK